MIDARLDDIRTATLDQVERSRRGFWWLLVVAGICEGLGIAAYLWVMDFGDRLHWLILIAAGLVYLTVAFWTAALSSRARMDAQLILRALERIDRHMDS